MRTSTSHPAPNLGACRQVGRSGADRTLVQGAQLHFVIDRLTFASAMSLNRNKITALFLAASAVWSLPAPVGAGAGCLDLASLTNNFRHTYPTGGPLERHAEEAGRKVMSKLLLDPSAGGSVGFLYSGDGPVTGARGRYLYVILDGQDCILKRDWIDGETYDRVVTQD